MYEVRFPDRVYEKGQIYIQLINDTKSCGTSGRYLGHLSMMYEVRFLDRVYKKGQIYIQLMIPNRVV